eukprot:scaffold710_cov171-Amphora_coffeaeformis.AAC.14
MAFLQGACSGFQVAGERSKTSTMLNQTPSDTTPLYSLSRKQALAVLGGLSSGSFAIGSARAEGETTPSIPACVKPPSGNSNCVSTASVRQVDLYEPPWTFPDSMSSDEAMARLKGVVSSDPKLEVMGQSDLYLKVRGTRNLGTDEIEFLINPNDKVITFISKRVDDPDGGDFGANRKRLDDLRKKSNGVFGVMGQEYSSADTAPRENAFGQLKAFYGLRSGGGYEDLLLGD